MQITILGGGGFLGRKLAARLARDGRLGGTPITGADAVRPGRTSRRRSRRPSRSAAWPATSPTLPRWSRDPGRAPDVVVHLAAVVSAQAEADYDLGTAGQPARHRRGGRGLPRAAAAAASRRAWSSPPPSPASPAGRTPWCRTTMRGRCRRNSYGAQKAIGGVAAGGCLAPRLPRRGLDPAADGDGPPRPAEPRRQLLPLRRSCGSRCWACRRELPVADDFAVWVCSPAPRGRLAAARRRDGHRAAGARPRREPAGISTTIAHLLQALDEVRPGASSLVRRVEDPAVAAIVGLWPPAFEPMRARTLGFAAHEPVVEVVRAFVEDDLEATRAERGLPQTVTVTHYRLCNRLQSINLPHSVTNPHRAG